MSSDCAISCPPASCVVERSRWRNPYYLKGDFDQTKPKSFTPPYPHRGRGDSRFLFETSECSGQRSWVDQSRVASHCGDHVQDAFRADDRSGRVKPRCRSLASVTMLNQPREDGCPSARSASFNIEIPHVQQDRELSRETDHATFRIQLQEFLVIQVFDTHRLLLSFELNETALHLDGMQP